jgi:uncharacterized membrane protein
MYYDHQRIKLNAKEHVKANQGNTIIVALLVMLLGLDGNSRVTFPRFNSSYGSSDYNHYRNYSSAYSSTHGAEDAFDKMFPFLTGLFAIIMFILLLVFLYSILVAPVIKMGAAGWFSRSLRQESPNISMMFSAFKFWGSAVCLSLLKSVYIFLWSLLLIVPGIIKGIAYSMTDYIKMDNPNLSASRVIEMSKIMTDGRKADLFYLRLSFIGWQLLSGLTCGILGIVYVNPYFYSAMAQAYEVLKAEAIDSGKLMAEEFVQLTY